MDGDRLPNRRLGAALFGKPDVDRLWQELAAVTRLDEDDPVEAWRSHVARLKNRAGSLGERRLEALRFRGPETDLTVGLLETARWLTAMSRTSWGQEHVVNLPTEEVYTTPDRTRTEGTVRMTAPLHWYGSQVDGGRLRFEDGRVVEAHADRGEEFLRAKLAVDEGASRLGEIALVDVDSAVGRRGRVFRNSLLDENASSHIAIGSGYTEPVPGAEAMDEERRVEAGINVSAIHIDLMIGGHEIDVDGVGRDGSVDVAGRGRLPVVLFCAGGIATPADAALMMQLGAEGNFVGSGIFKSSDPERRARAIVEATTHFDDAERVAAASRELGEAMPGIEIGTLEADGGLLQKRGW